MCLEVSCVGREVPWDSLLMRAYRYGVKHNIKKLNVKGNDVKPL